MLQWRADWPVPFLTRGSEGPSSGILGPAIVSFGQTITKLARHRNVKLLANSYLSLSQLHLSLQVLLLLPLDCACGSGTRQGGGGRLIRTSSGKLSLSGKVVLVLPPSRHVLSRRALGSCHQGGSPSCHHRLCYEGVCHQGGYRGTELELNIDDQSSSLWLQFSDKHPSNKKQVTQETRCA